MPNPLSDRGWSDNDYRAAIGTLVGEAAVRGGLQDYRAIADVIANRAQAGVYGRTISGITMNPSQFSTWKDSKKTAEALKSAKAGFAAALNEAVVGRMSTSMQQRVELAKQAVDDVFVNGKARGLTQGATHYHNAKVTARDNTDEYHKKLEKGGFIDIGAHRFSGPTFRDDPFDPITYNGQLAAPPSVDPFLGDIGVPVGQVSALGPVPDLTPSQPASAGSFLGFDIGDVTLPSDVYNDIMGGYALDGFTPFDAAPVDFSGVHIGHAPAQALASLGLENQRLSANVEVRPSDLGVSIDDRIAANRAGALAADDVAGRVNDVLGFSNGNLTNMLQDPYRTGYENDIGVTGYGQGYDPNLDRQFAGNAYTATPGLSEPQFSKFERQGVGYGVADIPQRTGFTDPLVDFGHTFGVTPELNYDASAITAGILHDDLAGFTAPAPATPDFSDIAAPARPSGFSAGFGEGPWGVTPDFDAPSLAQRNADQLAQDRISTFESGHLPGISYGNIDQMNADLMAELSPSTPQLATPSFDMQSAYAGDWADKFGGPQLSTPSVNTQAAPKAAAARSPSSQPAMGDYSQPAQTVAASRAPASVQAAPGAPQVNGPLSSITGPINSAISSVTDPINSAISSVTNPIKDSLKDMGFGGSTGFTVGGRPGDFLDAMASPTIANSYRTGAFDGWMGDALQGAALGALTGGPFGALTGGLWGGLNLTGHVGSMLGMANGGLFGNGFGGFFDTMANPYAGMSPQDLAAYGLDGDWTTREPTRNTGFEGGATRGDGSYSDSAGYNDNNPQGIL